MAALEKKSRACIIGVDIGGTNIRIGAVADDNSIIKEARASSDTIEGAGASEKLKDFIRGFICGLGESIEAISIGFPSILNRSRTVALSTPNLDGFDNMSVKAEYEKEFGIPVVIEKDACMLIYNDMEKFHIKRQGIIVGCYFGTGIGNIILCDGKPLVGFDGVAGELGHIPVMGKSDACGCGLYGCLELYASGKALERIRATKFPQTPIRNVFKEHAGCPEITEFIDNMSIAISTEINILNPFCIVLGGGVIAMKGFPYEKLLERVQARTRKPLPACSLNIIKSDTANVFNGVTGAAIFAREYLWEEVKTR
ncbi:MAG: allose kinase [Clostridiales bacterium]|jgi:allose kinase|nr:allose kinase [Clostridiales bacterium]